MRVHTARPLRADRAAPHPSAAPGVPEAVSDPPLNEVSEDPLQGQVTSLGRPAGSSGTGGGERTASGWRGPRAVTMAAPSPRKGARLM